MSYQDGQERYITRDMRTDRIRTLYARTPEQAIRSGFHADAIIRLEEGAPHVGLFLVVMEDQDVILHVRPA